MTTAVATPRCGDVAHPGVTKSELRQRMATQRDALDGGLRLREASALAVLLDHHLLAVQKPGTVVALYAARGSEVDLAALDDAARARRLRVVYPKVVDNSLVFALAAPTELSLGAFSVREPASEAPVVAATDIGCFVVPGLAFDRYGYRLGYGKGYYDRALAAAQSDASFVGVGFSHQLIECVPHGSSDFRLSHIATAAGIIAAEVVP